jgi:hypothetical protein
LICGPLAIKYTEQFATDAIYRYWPLHDINQEYIT